MKDICRYCGSEIYLDWVLVWRDTFGNLCPSEPRRHLPTINPSPGAPDVHKLLADATKEIERLRAEIETLRGKGNA